MLPRILIYLSILLVTTVNAQIVSIDPPFPTEDDTITVTFDATEGTAGLVGVNTVYAHTGVITNKSGTETDWRHVQGNWGTDDPKVKMTNIGNNKHQLRYHIRSFYNVPEDETVERLAFVFRNIDGSREGKATGGQDIFYNLFEEGFTISIMQPAPENFGIVLESNQNNLAYQAAANENALIQLYINDSLLNDSNGTGINGAFDPSYLAFGTHYLWVKAANANEVVYDSLAITVRNPNKIGVPPSSLKPGHTRTGDSSLAFRFFLPQKKYVYLLGDMNDWQYREEFQFYRSPDASTYFLEINGLDPEKEYRYQLAVSNGEETQLVANWYTEKVLDPWNDQYISEEIYPGLISYPTGGVNGIVSVVQLDEDSFNWQHDDFQPPAENKLMIYELLVRDFLSDHSYQSLIDSLDYLKRLGINAIELMPVNEFEGNESWGYNPSFYFAPDKYYGTKNDLKALVDAAHEKNIAIIVDIVLNHSFGQNPMVGLYFDPDAGQYGQPTANNPWFNQVEKHPFNVGYDFNHESNHTREFCKRVITHWIEEYHIDGYRFDLSKGFTQKNTLGDVEAMGRYDQSRIDILTDYANTCWSINEDFYVILEHFAENDEEQELVKRGMMVWGNFTHDAGELAMGYNGSFNWADYRSRDFVSPRNVCYMEKHDEERMMYKCEEFGNSSGGYDITRQNTALERVALTAALFYSIPGPKMLWQFGEMGYDYSINYCPDGTIDPDCRLANKPVRWDYLNNQFRKELYFTYAAILHLRNRHEAFHTDDFELKSSGSVQSIRLNGDSMTVFTIANFSVEPELHDMVLPEGSWYEYFSGDSLESDGSTQSLGLNQGEFRIYTSKALASPVVSVREIQEVNSKHLEVFPNPSESEVNVLFDRPIESGKLFIYASDGRHIQTLNLTKNTRQIRLNLSPGLYFLQVIDGSKEIGRTRLVIRS